MAEKDIDLTIEQMMKKNFLSAIDTLTMVIPVLEKMGEKDIELKEKEEQIQKIRQDIETLKNAEKNILDTNIAIKFMNFIEEKNEELKKAESEKLELEKIQQKHFYKFTMFAKYTESIKFYPRHFPDIIELDSFNVKQIIAFAFAFPSLSYIEKVKNTKYQDIIKLAAKSDVAFLHWIKYSFKEEDFN